MKAEPALEFSDLFRADNTDDSELAENEFGLIPDAAHPFEKLLSGTELWKRVGDFSWDEPVTAPLAKRSGAEPFSNPLGLSKSSVGYKLRVTRVEEREIGGETWCYAYSGAELVDAHLVRE